MRPVRLSTTLQPRVPPFQSPSFAIARWRSSSHATESGSRGASVTVPVWSMTPSSSTSTPVTVAVPADHAAVRRPVGRSISTRPLFSCSVTASCRPRIATYSGSGSVGAATPAATRAGSAEPSAAVSATGRADHVAGPPVRSTICTNPGGACGRSPSSPPGGVASSSRSFSMAMAA